VRIGYLENELTVAVAIEHAAALLMQGRRSRALGNGRSAERVDPDLLPCRHRLRLG
jgi:hypothetical protein